MNPKTDSVNSDTLLFSLDSLPILNNKTQLTNNLKLRFNKQSSLDLYIEITGFINKDHIGKTFSIERSQNKKDVFFSKLFDIITEKGNISLIKHTHINNSVFWTTSDFNIISDSTIIFSIKDELLSHKDYRLLKLIETLNSLETKIDKNVSEKYLIGYLEERGITCFNTYINS
jgi:hypothetical protein